MYCACLDYYGDYRDEVTAGSSKETHIYVSPLCAVNAKEEFTRQWVNIFRMDKYIFVGVLTKYNISST
jgi:hypothetical protein